MVKLASHKIQLRLFHSYNFCLADCFKLAMEIAESRWRITCLQRLRYKPTDFPPFWILTISPIFGILFMLFLILLFWLLKLSPHKPLFGRAGTYYSKWRYCFFCNWGWGCGWVISFFLALFHDLCRGSFGSSKKLLNSMWTKSS